MELRKQKTVYKVRYDRRESLMALLFVLPALAVYGLYNAFCVFMTFFYSFHKWAGISPKMDFIGIRNYITAFNDQGLMLALKNNIILVVVSLCVQIPVGMLLALLLASLRKGSKFFRTVYFMPMLLSTVATGLLWTYLYDPYFGLINAVLNAVGLSRWATAWLGQTSTALGAVLVVICWQYTPQYMILLRAGMTGIPEDIYRDTIAFATRYLNDAKKAYGRYRFMAGWWFQRHLAMELFRLGSLEFELFPHEEGKRIYIHSPTDASLAPEAIDDSVARLRAFTAAFYPEWADAPVYCDSWLMTPVLKDLLPENSRILAFQRRFRLLSVNADNMGAVEWVYPGHQGPYENLPEHTLLQKKMKPFLLAGGKPGWAEGIMKDD